MLLLFASEGEAYDVLNKHFNLADSIFNFNELDLSQLQQDKK